MIRTLCLMILLAICAETARSGSPLARFSPANIDKNADPCEDFYQYACGGWFAANPRPADKPMWGPWDVLVGRNEAVLREIAERARNPVPTRSNDQRLIGDYYAACMDESQSRQAIAPAVAQIDALQKKSDIAAEVATLHRSLYLALRNKFPSTITPGSHEPLFGFFPLEDYRDPTRVIAFVDQGGLGMGDRDYYLATDRTTREVRKAYLTYIGKVLSLAAGKRVPKQEPQRVLAMETALARAWMEAPKRIDPNNVYHAMSLEELEALAPSFAWSDYLKGVGAAPSPRYAVTNPRYLQEVEHLLASATLDDWKLYLRWQLLNAMAPMLDEPFARASFEFNGKVLIGLEQQEPRSRTCVRALDRDLGDALGTEFIKATLRISDMPRMEAIATAVKAALRQNIATSGWLGEFTRREALAKADAMRMRIGYAEKTRDYSSLKISRHGWANNAFLASDYEFSHLMRQIGSPPDTNDWWISAASADGYNNPRQVTISLPAGILQPPLFDADADDAINYGGLGALLGHELTHNFDTVGRYYDHRGVLRDWWSAEDAHNFKTRADCTVAQYSSYVVIDGLKINGELTASENIADAGGLRIALQAFNAAKHQADSARMAPGQFTPAQKFFLAYATGWCGNSTPAYLRSGLSDRHSPEKFRVNGVVSNLPEFQQAFACRKGQAMVHEPRCRVW
jgi:putative endopeptidase